MKVLSSIIRLSLVVSAALADKSRPDEQQMKMLLQSLSFPKTASKVTIPTAKTFNASAVKASKNAEFLKGTYPVQMSSFVSPTSSFHKTRALDESDDNQCVSDLTAILTDVTSPLNTLVLLANLEDLTSENLNCGVPGPSTTVCDGAGTFFDENFEGICSAELSGKVIETEVVLKVCPEYDILVQTVPACMPPSCDEETTYAFFNSVLSQLSEGEERNLKEDFHTERLLEDEECTPVTYMAPLGTYELPPGDKATQCLISVYSILDDPTSPLNPFAPLEDFDNILQYCQYEEGSPPFLDCDVQDAYSPDFSSLCIEAFGAGSRTKDIEYHVIPTSESDETTPATLLRNIPFCMPPSCEVGMVFYLLNQSVSDGEIDVSFKFEGTGGMECLKGTFDNYGIDISLGFEGPQFDIVKENALTPYAPHQILNEDNYAANCESNYLSDEKVEQLCDASIFDIEADCESVGGRYKEVDMFLFSYESETISGRSIEVDIEVRNLPFCVDKSCRKSELVKFMTLQYESQAQHDIDFIRSPIDQCTEKKSDLFNLKFKNDKMRRRNCNFLGKMKNLNRKKKLCGKPNGPRGSEAPRDSCPATCCRCAEYPVNQFVMKKVQGEPVTRTCKWLSEQSEEDIDLYCGKVNIGSATHGPAYSACPYTCGICEA